MEQIQQVKETYYEYINKVGEGCLIISDLIRKGSYQNALDSIENFAEGIEWLVTVQRILEGEGWVINSRIVEANDFLIEINGALVNQDLVTVADLFEYEIEPLFRSASEWVFVNKQED